MPKLGDLGGSVEVLREMRDSLVDGQRRLQVEEERWETFGRTSEKILTACKGRNLEELVSSVREMKNKLRRPAVRKELARLELGEEKKDTVPAKKDKNPVGACKCSSCGIVIDGSREPCVDGALCTDCALKNKVVPKGKQKKKKSVVPPPDSGMGGGQGQDQGGNDGGGAENEDVKPLRRRGYLS